MVNHHRKRQPTPGPDGAEAHGRVGTLDRSDLAAAQWVRQFQRITMIIYDILYSLK